MPGVNGGGPMWSHLPSREPTDLPSHISEHDELMLGHRDSEMESLDYEVVESVAYREDQVQLQLNSTEMPLYLSFVRHGIII